MLAYRKRLPSHTSVTIWEASAPDKLPTLQCPALRITLEKDAVRHPYTKEWYSGIDSDPPPTYPTHS